jgi:hypothetical protein
MEIMTKPLGHLMLDLETFGSESNFVIGSRIAAEAVLRASQTKYSFID